MKKPRFGSVYQIVCKVTHKRYIGSTMRWESRRRAHLSSLRRGKHHSAALQEEFNIYGEENFIIAAIEREEWIDWLDYKKIDDYMKKMEYTYIAISDPDSLYNRYTMRPKYKYRPYFITKQYHKQITCNYAESRPS